MSEPLDNAQHTLIVRVPPSQEGGATSYGHISPDHLTAATLKSGSGIRVNHDPQRGFVSISAVGEGGAADISLFGLRRDGAQLILERHDADTSVDAFDWYGFHPSHLTFFIDERGHLIAEF